MNTRIATFVMALVLASVACNGVTPKPDPTSTPIPTATVTSTPLPSATPEPLIPYIENVLWNFKSSNTHVDLIGVFPYTHLPKDANVIEVTFYLHLPVGWPKEKTEFHVMWYRDGSPLQDWDGSIVCAPERASYCTKINSSHFSQNRYEPGRYEARVYFGDQLLQGPEAIVWLIEEEWVGDLRLMQCDRGTVDTCENDAGQGPKFPREATVPLGSKAIWVSNGFANLPPRTDWRLELYDEAGQLIDSKPQATPRDDGIWSGWSITQLADPSGAAFRPGTYTVRLVWKVEVVETTSFEVK